MEPLKNLIKRKKQKHGLKKTLEVYELFEEWNKNSAEIFGDKNVRCHPRFVRGKTLYVQVEGGPAAAELQMRQGEIVDRINKHFEKKKLDRIVFKL